MYWYLENDHLVLNGGSSTLKATLRELDGSLPSVPPPPLWEAQADWGRRPSPSTARRSIRGTGALPGWRASTSRSSRTTGAPGNSRISGGGTKLASKRPSCKYSAMRWASRGSLLRPCRALTCAGFTSSSRNPCFSSTFHTGRQSRLWLMARLENLVDPAQFPG